MVSVYHVAAMYLIDMNQITIFCISLHSNVDHMCTGQYTAPPCEKCSDENACLGTDESQIGCGSCIGYSACRYLSSTVTIGTDSCVGLHACEGGSGKFNYCVVTNKICQLKISHSRLKQTLLLRLAHSQCG